MAKRNKLFSPKPTHFAASDSSNRTMSGRKSITGHNKSSTKIRTSMLQSSSSEAELSVRKKSWLSPDATANGGDATKIGSFIIPAASSRSSNSSNGSYLSLSGSNNGSKGEEEMIGHRTGLVLGSGSSDDSATADEKHHIRHPHDRRRSLQSALSVVNEALLEEHVIEHSGSKEEKSNDQDSINNRHLSVKSVAEVADFFSFPQSEKDLTQADCGGNVAIVSRYDLQKPPLEGEEEEEKLQDHQLMKREKLLEACQKEEEVENEDAAEFFTRVDNQGELFNSILDHSYLLQLESADGQLYRHSVISALKREKSLSRQKPSSATSLFKKSLSVLRSSFARSNSSVRILPVRPSNSIKQIDLEPSLYIHNQGSFDGSDQADIEAASFQNISAKSQGVVNQDDVVGSRNEKSMFSRFSASINLTDSSVSLFRRSTSFIRTSFLGTSTASDGERNEGDVPTGLNFSYVFDRIANSSSFDEMNFSVKEGGTAGQLATENEYIRVLSEKFAVKRVVLENALLKKGSIGSKDSQDKSTSLRRQQQLFPAIIPEEGEETEDEGSPYPFS
jgi:hypothetical protein